METNYVIGLTGVIAVFAVLLFALYKLNKRTNTNTHTVTSTEGKFERKHYRFANGLKCYQEQLNLNQNEEYSKLLAEAKIDNAGEIDMFKLNKILWLDKGMRQLLCIILINEKGEVLNDEEKAKLETLKESEVDLVLEDFFTLNPAKKVQFEILKLTAVSQTAKKPLPGAKKGN